MTSILWEYGGLKLCSDIEGNVWMVCVEPDAVLLSTAALDALREAVQSAIRPQTPRPT